MLSIRSGFTHISEISCTGWTMVEQMDSLSPNIRVPFLASVLETGTAPAGFVDGSTAGLAAERIRFYGDGDAVMDVEFYELARGSRGRVLYKGFSMKFVRTTTLLMNLPHQLSNSASYSCAVTGPPLPITS